MSDVQLGLGAMLFMNSTSPGLSVAFGVDADGWCVGAEGLVGVIRFIGVAISLSLRDCGGSLLKRLSGGVCSRVKACAAARALALLCGVGVANCNVPGEIGKSWFRPRLAGTGG